MQPRPPQIHRARPHRHQRQPTLSAPHLLQEQEIPATRPAPEADKGDPAALNEARGKHYVGEAEEEVDAFPAEEVCG